MALATALLTGCLAGYLLRAGRGVIKAPEAVAAIRSKVTPKWTREDFLRFAKEEAEKRKLPAYNPYSDILADWTNGELRDALEMSLANPDCILSGGAAPELPSFLMGEWMERDLDSALAWFESLDEGPGKSRIAHSLGYQWPADQAEKGLAFVLASRDRIPGSAFIVEKCIRQSFQGGPAAVEELLCVLREENLEARIDIDGLEVPPGFDFQSLMAGEEVRTLLAAGKCDSLVFAWYAQDRDAAFDWQLQNQGAKSLGGLAWAYDGRADENLKWLGGKISELSPNLQGEFLDTVFLGWARAPSSASRFASGIQDPGLQERTRVLFGIQAIYAGNAHDALPLLEALPDPARRIEVLETAEPAVALSEKKWLREFDGTDEALLRRKLTEWGAGEPRTESIISRFKK